MEKKTTRLRAFLESRGITPGKAALWLGTAAAVLAAAVFFGSTSAGNRQIFPVYITEVMASNTSYPNAEGLCCDYIEIRNSADYSVDLTGFQMGDIAGKSRYAFPAGTVLQPGEYRVISCSKLTASADYAPFEINRAGGESFYLIGRNGAIVDSVTTLPMDVDQVMLLQADGSWLVSGDASPGGSIDGFNAGDIYIEALSPVRFSEFSGADTMYLPEQGIYCDWVELHNSGDEPADISGFILSDNPGNDKFTFPANTVIGPGGYLTVPCTDLITDSMAAPFGLSRQATETLVLKNNRGQIVEILHTTPGEKAASALTAGGSWEDTDDLSPGFDNSPQGCLKFLEESGTLPGAVRISEVMAARQLLIADACDKFSDWVELYNTTGEPVNLSGWYLSDDPAQPRKWTIRNMTLEPGQRKIIFCSGREAAPEGEVHADFSLSSGGETLTLSAWTGKTVDSVAFPESRDHTSWIFEEGGQITSAEHPTPGYSNDEAGYLAFQDSRKAPGPLAIWEVMTSNDRYIPQNLGQCYDWVELRNISGETLDLSGWCLSDDLDNPGLHRLDGTTLKPGETMIVILSEEPGAAKKGVSQAPFQLNAKDDQLFLFDPQGKLADFVHLKDIPLGFSMGRAEDAGGFFYMEPSPQNPNIAGHRLISGAIAASCVPGVYSLEEGTSVTLEAQGTMYYTTDGSEPDAGSLRYEGPLKISSTTVLRAVSIEEGKLPGQIYTATFIVGDKHELPVVSLVTDPENLWGRNGIYKNDIRVKEILVPSHISYSGADGSWALNCATTLHGATTVTAFSKKTFSIRFQDRFDGPLHYDVFGDGVVTDFSSLLIRTAHESTFSSQMHDAFICHVAAYNSDKMVSQKHKYVALYLNGEYWGLYAIRERHSQEHFAGYMNVPAESVDIVRFMIQEKNTLNDLFQFCQHYDLRSEKNYAYAKSIINMESYADWLICEAYMANVDVNYNMRFYRNPADGLWYMGLSDLDLGMVGSHDSFSMMAKTFHHGVLIDDLLRNEEFQHLLATRLAELLAGPLSDENAIALINQMADTIRPEAAWEAERWNTPVHNWESTVKEMLRFCDGRAQELIDNFCQELHLTREERKTYFGHLE